MKTSPKFILIFSLLCTLGGLVLRMVQLSRELLPGGILAQGSYLHIVLMLLCLLLAGVLTVFLLPLEKRKIWDQALSPWPLTGGLMLLSSIGLLAGNLLLLLKGVDYSAIGSVAAPKVVIALQKLQPLCGLAGAACIAAFALQCLYGKKPASGLAMAASLYLAVRLIVHFQAWNTDPFVHDYAFRLMAAICTMLAVFQLGGFSFDKGKRRITLFWSLMALLFCGISAADSVASKDWSEILLNTALAVLMLAISVQLLFCKGAAPYTPPVEEAELSPEEEGAKREEIEKTEEKS